MPWKSFQPNDDPASIRSSFTPRKIAITPKR